MDQTPQLAELLLCGGLGLFRTLPLVIWNDFRDLSEVNTAICYVCDTIFWRSRHRKSVQRRSNGQAKLRCGHAPGGGGYKYGDGMEAYTEVTRPSVQRRPVQGTGLEESPQGLLLEVPVGTPEGVVVVPAGDPVAVVGVEGVPAVGVHAAGRAVSQAL